MSEVIQAAGILLGALLFSWIMTRKAPYRSPKKLEITGKNNSKKKKIKSKKALTWQRPLWYYN